MTVPELIGVAGGTLAMLATFASGGIFIARWARAEASTAKSIDGRIASLNQRVDDGFDRIHSDLDSMHELLKQRIDHLDHESDLQRSRYHDEIVPLMQRVIALEEKE